MSKVVSEIECIVLKVLFYNDFSNDLTALNGNYALLKAIYLQMKVVHALLNHVQQLLNHVHASLNVVHASLNIIHALLNSVPASLKTVCALPECVQHCVNTVQRSIFIEFYRQIMKSSGCFANSSN